MASTLTRIPAGRFRISVKREGRPLAEASEGSISNFSHDRVEEGGRVEVAPPCGVTAGGAAGRSGVRDSIGRARVDRACAGRSGVRGSIGRARSIGRVEVGILTDFSLHLFSFLFVM